MSGIRIAKGKDRSSAARIELFANIHRKGDRRPARRLFGFEGSGSHERERACARTSGPVSCFSRISCDFSSEEVERTVANFRVIKETTASSDITWTRRKVRGYRGGLARDTNAPSLFRRFYMSSEIKKRMFVISKLQYSI